MIFNREAMKKRIIATKEALKFEKSKTRDTID